MIDLTTRFQATCCGTGKLNEAGTDPGIRFMEVLCDPQTSLAYGDFPEFLSSTGIGLSVTAGESRWQLGGVEVDVKATKKTMKKIRTQEPNLPPVVGNLAAMAGNHTLKVKGFTASHPSIGPMAWTQLAMREMSWPRTSSKSTRRSRRSLRVSGISKDFEIEQTRSAAEKQPGKPSEDSTTFHNAAPRPANQIGRLRRH